MGKKHTISAKKFKRGYKKSRAKKIRKNDSFGIDYQTFGLTEEDLHYDEVRTKKEMRNAPSPFVLNTKKGLLYYNENGSRKGWRNNCKILKKYQYF